jgi:PEP-CTERM motif
MRTFIALSFVFSCMIVGQGAARAASICNTTAGNLVANCGFETGDFTSWTLSGNDVPAELNNLYGVEGTDPLDSIAPNSGSYQGWFADLDANATTLSQAIATNPGDTYAISFYLAQDTTPVSPYSNTFSASFGGTSLISLSPVSVESYTKYTYTGTATAGSSQLSFVLGNDLGEFLLDDVVVTDTTITSTTPEPSTWALFLISCVLAGLAVRKFRKA